ncbi:hypothetical protein [Ancylobacter defluvii]|uniref:Integrase n=1 Tax=Ancylobacter defluvii TaxID=1282440 RepID=A0A9W6N9W3_9HYPH|nr:hypothetical protein [Ancylobacter defluvii]GLK82826.1 hypothetical protein GCM10017653_08950 [Ancylobacter defluvii]
MGHSQFDDAIRGRAAWSAGKKVGTKRPFTQKQIWAIRFFLDRERRIRDRALFDLAVDSKLRGCDLVKIRIRDVVAGPEIKTRGIVVQQKTAIRSSLIEPLIPQEAKPQCQQMSVAGRLPPTQTLGQVRYRILGAKKSSIRFRLPAVPFDETEQMASFRRRPQHSKRRQGGRV